MTMSNVELYEALKRGNLGEEAARMLAEVVPPASELVTKAHLTEEIRALEHRMEARFEKVDERFEKVNQRFEKVDERFARVDEQLLRLDDHIRELDHRLTDISEKVTRYILLFFVPLWITAAAAIVTSLLGG